MKTSLRRTLLTAASVAALAIPATGYAASVKNVIMMVSDGASWGTWDMASYYQYGQKGQQVYDQFDVKLGMTTQPLNGSPTPTNDPTPQIIYDPAKAWDGTPTTEGSFAGYDNIKMGYTDSAAAGTALATGEKTYNNAISYDNNGQPLARITETFKNAGRSTGVVTSVPFTHATPAAFGAQNISRNHYGEIASQMVNEGVLDLIMGAGHPDFDDSGRAREAAFTNETGTGNNPTTGPGTAYTPKSVWDALKGENAPMTLIDEKADFEALANGSKTVDGRLIGVAQVASTLQYNRDKTAFGADAANATGVAYNSGVPTLELMTKGALNHLGKNENGFFVMIEGGAVDWAAHANDTAGIIDEQIDFNHSVQAAYDWVETYSNWDDTMLLVLTDHGNGMPMGPNSDTNPFEAVQNNGAGNLPGVKWHYGTHTIENTLLWAHGAGAQALNNHVIGSDPWLSMLLGHNQTGAYTDNTLVNQAILEAAGLAPAPVPVPAGIVLMGTGVAAFAALRRRRRAA